MDDVNRIESKNGEGQNKLRTYRQFKKDISVEPYVSLNIKKSHRKALARFRSGTAPINLELLRYGSMRLPANERKCISCKDEVESECHVLIQCPLYHDIREDCYNSLKESCINYDSFKGLNDNDKMCFLLSNPKCTRIVARTCFNILERRRILTYV